MASDGNMNDFERAAGGLDFDDSFRDKASDIGAALADGDPSALLDQLEELLPESWREQIARYPITAVLIGAGIGLFLGMKKGDELLAAGTALVTSAASANVARILGQPE